MLMSYCTDIGVDVIASFKKMQSLTTDKSLVLKAIKSSSMLEVEEISLETLE